MQIDLTDDETRALLALIDRAMAIDAFSLSPLTRSLPRIRHKLIGPASPGPSAVQPARHGWARG